MTSKAEPGNSELEPSLDLTTGKFVLTILQLGHCSISISILSLLLSRSTMAEDHSSPRNFSQCLTLSDDEREAYIDMQRGLGAPEGVLQAMIEAGRRYDARRREQGLEPQDGAPDGAPQVAPDSAPRGPGNDVPSNAIVLSEPLVPVARLQKSTR